MTLHFSPNKCLTVFFFFLDSLFWNRVNMSQISITSRSSLAANYFKHRFCFYAFSICLEAFVCIFWFGISATSYTCQSSEPFRGSLCCPYFSQVHHQLAPDKLCKASVNLRVFAVLQPFFTTLLYKNMNIIFPNIVYFSANRLVPFLFILSLFLQWVLPFIIGTFLWVRLNFKCVLSTPRQYPLYFSVNSLSHGWWLCFVFPW